MLYFIQQRKLLHGDLGRVRFGYVLEVANNVVSHMEVSCLQEDNINGVREKKTKKKTVKFLRKRTCLIVNTFVNTFPGPYKNATYQLAHILLLVVWEDLKNQFPGYDGDVCMIAEFFENDDSFQKDVDGPIYKDLCFDKVNGDKYKLNRSLLLTRFPEKYRIGKV